MLIFLFCICAVLAFLIGYLFGAGNWTAQDLSLNLVAELIGVLLTVGIVQRLLDGESNKRSALARAELFRNDIAVVRFVLDHVSAVARMREPSEADVSFNDEQWDEALALLRRHLKQYGAFISPEADRLGRSMVAQIEKIKGHTGQVPLVNDMWEVWGATTNFYLAVLDGYWDRSTGELLSVPKELATSIRAFKLDRIILLEDEEPS